MTALNWLVLAGIVLLLAVDRLRIRLLAATLLYLALDAAARLGARLAKRALELDLRIGRWRHELERREGAVTTIAGRIAGHVRAGATRGEEEYEFLNARDMDLLARAIDNLGCHVQVWPTRLQWRRRDLHCRGANGLLSLYALAPADRDAWADALANLDGETTP